MTPFLYNLRINSAGVNQLQVWLAQLGVDRGHEPSSQNLHPQHSSQVV